MNKIFIKEINLISFGKFQNKTITFDKGFNLIYGNNESGKSTISDFIEGMFYGFDTGNNKKNFSYKKEKYKPIGSYKYAGNMILFFDGKKYRIERDFEDGSYSIFDLLLNKEIPSKKSNLNYPGEYLLDLNYSLYKNIVSNYQMQGFDKDSNKNLINFLKDPSSDLVFSQLKSIENIENRLSKIGSIRAYTKPFAKNKKELDEKLNELERIKNIRNTYDHDIKRLQNQREEIKKIEKNLYKLKTDRDNYRNYKANSNFIEYKSRKDSLKLLDSKLEKYKNFDKIDKLYFERLDKLLYDKSKIYKNSNEKFNYFLFLIPIFLLLISIFSKKYWILILLIPIFLSFYIYNRTKYVNKKEKISDLNIKINNEFSKIFIHSKSEYENAKSDYKEYEKIIIDKEKNLEILKILEKQEISENISEFDIEDLNISKIESDIRKYEASYHNLIENNLKLEKKLAKVEDEISKEIDLVDDINKLKDNQKQLEIEIMACKKAIEIIESNKNKLDNNRKKISTYLSEIIKQISKGKYKKIDLDQELNPIIYKENNEIISMDKLSVGFFDQVNFSLRFSISKDLLNNSFLIFDDAFINYDNSRLRMALLYLLDLSNEFQMIYFTCHDREEKILKAEGIEIKVKDIDEI